jgi:hypothetical protein
MAAVAAVAAAAAAAAAAADAGESAAGTFISTWRLKTDVHAFFIPMQSISPSACESVCAGSKGKGGHWQSICACVLWAGFWLQRGLGDVVGVACWPVTL